MGPTATKVFLDRQVLRVWPAQSDHRGFLGRLAWMALTEKTDLSVRKDHRESKAYKA